ncbi:MAG TPA: hypothetical protein VIY69_13590 [Candidatus Acidoferrales bacterium]
MASVLTVETTQAAGDVSNALGGTPGRERGNGRDPSRWLSDDEILGLGDRTRSRRPDADVEGEFGEDAPIAADSLIDGKAQQDANDTAPVGDGDSYREVFDANPELKRAWDEAQAYREAFATPEEASAATKIVADVRTMDALFFSKRSEDHAELAKMVAKVDPEAFASLAKAMGAVAAGGKVSERAENRAGRDEADARQTAAATHAGEQLVQAANAEAVRGVIQAIEGQVERVLPQYAPRAARERVVGEIYRELDKALQTNPDFVKHVRNAVRSGKFDAGHQSAVVSLIVGRAKQTLPSVAKRVLNEWTSTILAANQDRRTKQRSAESRVDVAGARGGSDTNKARSPRDIDYNRMSDADILNL